MKNSTITWKSVRQITSNMDEITILITDGYYVYTGFYDSYSDEFWMYEYPEDKTRIKKPKMWAKLPSIETANNK